LQEISYL